MRIFLVAVGLLVAATVFVTPADAVGVCQPTPAGPVCAHADLCDTPHSHGACVGVRTPVGGAAGGCQANVGGPGAVCHADAGVPGVAHVGATVGTRGACVGAFVPAADTGVRQCVAVPHAPV